MNLASCLKCPHMVLEVGGIGDKNDKRRFENFLGDVWSHQENAWLNNNGGHIQDQVYLWGTLTFWSKMFFKSFFVWEKVL
jgi:hypothetical protein